MTATANLIMQDVRPRIADISDQTVAIVRFGREQVERVGDLLHDEAPISDCVPLVLGPLVRIGGLSIRPVRRIAIGRTR